MVSSAGRSSMPRNKNARGKQEGVQAAREGFAEKASERAALAERLVEELAGKLKEAEHKMGDAEKRYKDYKERYESLKDFLVNAHGYREDCVRDDGDVFEGFVHNGVPEGWGVCEYKDGCVSLTRLSFSNRVQPQLGVHLLLAGAATWGSGRGASRRGTARWPSRKEPALKASGPPAAIMGAECTTAATASDSKALGTMIGATERASTYSPTAAGTGKFGAAAIWSPGRSSAAATTIRRGKVAMMLPAKAKNPVSEKSRHTGSSVAASPIPGGKGAGSSHGRREWGRRASRTLLQLRRTAAPRKYGWRTLTGRERRTLLSTWPVVLRPATRTSGARLGNSSDVRPSPFLFFISCVVGKKCLTLFFCGPGWHPDRWQGKNLAPQDRDRILHGVKEVFQRIELERDRLGIG